MRRSHPLRPSSSIFPRFLAYVRNSPDAKHTDKAQAFGLDAFLLKPFLHRDLGLAVYRVPEKHGAQRR
jgi:hypothetical protein